VNIDGLMREPNDGPGLPDPCAPGARADSGSMSGGYIICHLPITSNPIALEVYGLTCPVHKDFLYRHERFTQHLEEKRINIAKMKPEPRRAPARIEDTPTLFQLMASGTLGYRPEGLNCSIPGKRCWGRDRGISACRVAYSIRWCDAPGSPASSQGPHNSRNGSRHRDRIPRD
jgi:hypothetical protein